ncbi:hypothetical protein B0H19DRAFT_1140137 [Mycena capillaripes]|nr:hypothetical protein B0H19DRAFT_1140137 [Mycena capillaripes]
MPWCATEAQKPNIHGVVLKKDGIILKSSFILSRRSRRPWLAKWTAEGWQWGQWGGSPAAI